MEVNDHKKWAKEALKYQVFHIQNFMGGYKYITYGELAKKISYPAPHTGNLFGKNIGMTLGVMGHMLEDIKIVEWPGKIPMIQSLVVAQNTKLPSDGLKEFNSTYPSLSNDKKRDFVNNEYPNIFLFGNRWNIVLEKLGIYEKEVIPHGAEILKEIHYNPYGSEGSPEHKALRDHIANNPSVIGLKILAKGITEYPLKSGDSIDVLFEDADNIICVEVKSIRSGYDDIERGIFQCIKYASVLNAELSVRSEKKMVSSFLVIENEPNSRISSIAKLLNIPIIKFCFNS